MLWHMQQQKQQQQPSHNSCYMQFIFRCCILMKSAKKKKKNKREVGEMKRSKATWKRALSLYLGDLWRCFSHCLQIRELAHTHTHTHREAEQLHCCMRVCVCLCVWKAKEIRKQTGWQPDLAFICGLIKRKLVTMQRCLFKVFAAAARKSH